jgi:hypothetical protein
MNAVSKQLKIETDQSLKQGNPSSVLQRENLKRGPEAGDRKVELPYDIGDFELVKSDEVADVKKGSLNAGSSGIRGKASHAGSALPHPLNCVTTVSNMTRRFYSITDNAFPITANMLAGAFGCVCYTANTNARAYWATMRIRSIKAWPPVGTTTALGQVDVRWGTLSSSAFVKDEDVVTSLPLGMTISKGLTFTPPPKALSSDWISLGQMGTGVLFTIDVPIGAIIDVSVDATLANNTLGATIALSTTQAVGVAGYTPLDGSNCNLRPIGVANVM